MCLGLFCILVGVVCLFCPLTILEGALLIMFGTAMWCKGVSS